MLHIDIFNVFGDCPRYWACPGGTDIIRMKTILVILAIWIGLNLLFMGLAYYIAYKRGRLDWWIEERKQKKAERRRNKEV